MSRFQRAKLIRTLRETYRLESLAVLTDSELFEQWLFDCEYEGGVSHVPESAIVAV